MPMTAHPPVWSEAAVRSIGVTTDLATAGSIVGLSRTRAYEALRAGTFPVPVFRIGRRIVVPTAPLLRLLALDVEAAGPPHPPGLPADLPNHQPPQTPSTTKGGCDAHNPN